MCKIKWEIFAVSANWFTNCFNAPLFLLTAFWTRGILDRVLGREDRDIEDYEEDLEKLKIRTEIQGVKSELAQRTALEKEIKTKYGPAWKKLLGLKGIISVPTLRSALKDEVNKIKMRFRQSHFPFTEPSAEVDIGYEI